MSRYYSRYAEEYPYPMGGYGNMFKAWSIKVARQGIYEPYNSCGNGSAMRVAPVGWAFETEREVLVTAEVSARCTHNHPEGIKGAQATALYGIPPKIKEQAWCYLDEKERSIVDLFAHKYGIEK